MLIVLTVLRRRSTERSNMFFGLQKRRGHGGGGGIAGRLIGTLDNVFDTKVTCETSSLDLPLVDI